MWIEVEEKKVRRFTDTELLCGGVRCRSEEWKCALDVLHEER